MQSPAEWDVRNTVIGQTLGNLVQENVIWEQQRGLDVGCQAGQLTDTLSERTGAQWTGIDPAIGNSSKSPMGRDLKHGWGHEIPFDDGTFDCVLFANVYEHVLPECRLDTLGEIRRVLRPGGVVVGQIPNSRFLIESHSRLPLMGWLPLKLQKQYWKLSPVPWNHDFFVVSGSRLLKDAAIANFEPVLLRNFNYPPEAFPQSVRKVAHLLEAPMRKFPWAWQFVLRRPDVND